MLSNQVMLLDPLYLDDDPVLEALGVDCDQSPADLAVFHAGPLKVEVMMAGVVVTETCAGSASTPVVKFDLRPTAGSDTSRGDGDIGNLALSTTAAGKVMYDEAAVGELIEPGEEVVFQLVTAASGTPSGHVRPFLLVRPCPELPANLTNMVETA